MWPSVCVCNYPVSVHCLIMSDPMCVYYPVSDHEWPYVCVLSCECWLYDCEWPCVCVLFVWSWMTHAFGLHCECLLCDHEWHCECSLCDHEWPCAYYPVSVHCVITNVPMCVYYLSVFILLTWMSSCVCITLCVFIVWSWVTLCVYYPVIVHCVITNVLMCVYYPVSVHCVIMSNLLCVLPCECSL